MRIRLPLSGRTFFVWFGALFMCVGLILLYTGVQDATREQAYQKQGQVVEAVVVNKSIKRASREGNSSTKYEIVYRFTTADGRTAESVDAVSVEEWESLDRGSPFKVAYLPGEPQSSRAEGSGGMQSPLIMTGLGSLLALIGGVLFVRTATRVWRDRRLLREGMTAPGTVLAIEPSSVAVNRVRQWNVRYRYEDHFGRPQEGTSGPLTPEEAQAVEVGDALTVRFDRQHPEESIWDRTRMPVPEGTTEASGGKRRQSFLKRLGGFAVMLTLFFVAMVVGESIPALKDLERLMIPHQAPLLAITIGMTVIGFVLFMGGILSRIFGGAGEPMTHAEVEDLSRSVRLEARPALARVSWYRFRGRSAGSSFLEQFTLREAKEAWRQRAWRASPRWRSNFVVMIGVLLLAPGLFGIFIVLGPNGIKLLCGGALVYAAVRTITGFVRA
ncbi:MAG: DUF3592 domain-containing protein [Candidatus Rokuibacteriota bacterium]